MLLIAALLATSDFQSTVLLDRLVAEFTGRDIGQPGGARAAVDTRLKLAACPAPQLEWRNADQDAVLIRCLSPGWRLFVPVETVPKPKPVAAAAAPAPVKVEPVIRRGDPVTVEAAAAGFSVTREGIAMGDAVPGARLLVKVDEKRTPIQAIAIEPGHVRLPGFEE